MPLYSVQRLELIVITAMREGNEAVAASEVKIPPAASLPFEGDSEVDLTEKELELLLAYGDEKKLLPHQYVWYAGLDLDTFFEKMKSRRVKAQNRFEYSKNQLAYIYALSRTPTTITHNPGSTGTFGSPKSGVSTGKLSSLNSILQRGPSMAQALEITDEERASVSQLMKVTEKEIREKSSNGMTGCGSDAESETEESEEEEAQQSTTNLPRPKTKPASQRYYDYLFDCYKTSTLPEAPPSFDIFKATVKYVRKHIIYEPTPRHTV